MFPIIIYFLKIFRCLRVFPQRALYQLKISFEIFTLLEQLLSLLDQFLVFLLQHLSFLFMRVLLLLTFILKLG